jgi:hypothetical protein
MPWEKVGRNTIWYMVSYRTVLVSYRTVMVSYRMVLGLKGEKTACVKRTLDLEKIFLVFFRAFEVLMRPTPLDAYQFTIS